MDRIGGRSCRGGLLAVQTTDHTGIGCKCCVSFLAGPFPALRPRRPHPMNDIRFCVPPEGKNAQLAELHLAEESYLATWQGVPLSAPGTMQSDWLTLVPRVGESGYAMVPWFTTKGRLLRLMTATVRLRDEPYLLSVELARGTISRVRTWWDEWLRLEWYVSESLQEQLDHAQRVFAQAACNQSDVVNANQDAQESIEWALEVIDGLAACYVEAMCAPEWRRHHAPAILATRIPFPFPQGEETANLKSTFRGGILDFHPVHPVSKAVAWGSHNLQFTMIGPVLDLGDSFDAVTNPRCRQLAQAESSLSLVQGVGSAKLGKVHLWYVLAGLDVGREGNGKILTLDERLHVLEKMITTIRSHDPNALVMLGIDHPWGEHLVQDSGELPPLEVARQALRSGLGISAIGVNFTLACHAGYPLAPDELAMVDHLDAWAQLQVPLVVLLTATNSRKGEGDSTSYKDDSTVVEKRLAEVLDRWIPLLARHPAVMALVGEPWRNSTEEMRNAYPLWIAGKGGTQLLNTWRTLANLNAVTEADDIAGETRQG